MADYEKIKKQTSKNYADSEAAAIQAAKDAANANIKLIEDDYGTQIADAKAAYDPLFRQNEIQRAVNERFLERKAAEMGLTDSGLSRTQQTANQLSYGNQNAEYMRQRQKAVDTLKAAMDAKILEQNTNLNTNIAGIKTSYADKRTADAVSMYNEAVKSETELEKEKLKYINDAAKTATDNFNDLYNTLKSEYKANNSDDLGAALDETKISPVHAAMIYEYQKQSGLPTNSTQMKMLLNAAGISAEDYIVQTEEYAAEDKKRSYDVFSDEEFDAEFKKGTIDPTGTAKAKSVLNNIKTLYSNDLIYAPKRFALLAESKAIQEKLDKANAWDLFWNGSKWKERIDEITTELKELPENKGIDLDDDTTRDRIWAFIQNGELSRSEQVYVATQLGLQNY